MRYYTFEPIYKSTIWGARHLENLFGRNLPVNERIGEAWDLVDRPNEQSKVVNCHTTLHDLWTSAEKKNIFGRKAPNVERFPLLIKLIDAAENLSLQVHPPRKIAQKLGYESKDEVWYFLHTQPGARIYAGFKKQIKPADFKTLIQSESREVEEWLHTIPTAPDEAMFVPAARLHSIGKGNLLLEVQTSSDTTFRLYDWARMDDKGKPRTLQIEEGLSCIDFHDLKPTLIQPHGERIISTSLFEIRRLGLDSHQTFEVPIDPRSFEYWFIVRGSASFEGRNWKMGEAALISASAGSVILQTEVEPTSILRVRWP